MCTENSTTYFKQCKIAWYVDEKELSHVDENANTRIIEAISENFGELTILRGKITRLWEWTYSF